MSSTPFMQLYVADYMADTRHLTTEQHGAYLLILMTMWKAGARLPNDPAKLARIAGVTLRRWSSIWDEIADFFTVDGDHITQRRLAEEYQKAASKSEKRSASGSLGGKAKALKNKNPAVANATVLLKHSSEPELEVKEEPIGSSKKPSARRAVALPADWVPSDRNVDDAVDRGFSQQEIENEADKFRDHHLARGTAFKDWDAGWRTWLGNARKFAARGGMAGPSGSSGYGQGSSLASIAARRRVAGQV